MPTESTPFNPEIAQRELLLDYKQVFENLGKPVDGAYFEQDKPIFNVQTGEKLETRQQKLEQLNRLLETEFLDRRDMCLAEQLIFAPGENTEYLRLQPALQEWSVPDMLDATEGIQGLRGKIRVLHYHNVADRLSEALTDGQIIYSNHDADKVYTVSVDSSAGSNIAQNFIFSVEGNPREFRYPIKSMAEVVKEGNIKFTKNGVDVTEEVSTELTRLTNQEEAYSAFELYMRGTSTEFSYLFPDIDDLPLTERKEFYKNWAHMLGELETIIVDASKPETQIADLVGKLKTALETNPAVIGQREKWALQTGCVEIVKAKVRAQYAQEFEENGAELANILFGFEPHDTTMRLSAKGSLVVDIKNAKDYAVAEKGKLANTQPIGGGFFRAASQIKVISGSLQVLGPTITPDYGAEEHEDCHRFNHMMISGLRAKQQSILVAETPAGAPKVEIEDAISGLIMSDYVRFQDEIIAYGVQSRVNGNMKDFVGFLTEVRGLYDNFVPIYKSLAPKMSQADAFKVAFSTPKLESIRSERDERIRKLAELASKVEDVNLLRAVPIHEWEEILG